MPTVVKNLRSIVAMAVLFVVVQLAAIAFMEFALTPEDRAFENPGDPLIAFYYVLLMIGFTAVFIVLIKYGKENLLKAVMFMSIGFVLFFVCLVLLAQILNAELLIIILAVAISAISVYALWTYPEWYVVDSVGILMAIGIVALLGISLSVLPVLLLLSALAIYDFIAVYKTKHMLTLADGVADMGLPMILVVPKKLPYSYREKRPKIAAESKEEREAFLMGLGDIIIPGLLPASAFWFIDTEKVLLGIDGNLFVALGAVIGGLCAFLFLMRLVNKGNPQPGLPFLNVGVIVGYVVAYLVVFGTDLSQLI